MPDEPSDREHWNRRHREWSEPRPPDPLVLEALDVLGAGAGRRALDLASGGGRHALELARRGWSVTAWDVSDVALDQLGERAARAGLQLATRRLDLARDPLPAERFALVLEVDYLDRALLARAHELLEPDGELVFVMYTVDHVGERPSRRFRLERGELAAGLPGLVTVAYSENAGRAVIRARKPPVDS